MSENDIIVYFATAINILFYIPQLYAIYASKNYNYYSLIPQGFLMVASALLTYYAIQIDHTELIINNCIVFILSIAEFLLIGYYAYYNEFSSVPHEKFQEQLRRNASKIDNNAIETNNIKEDIETLKIDIALLQEQMKNLLTEV